MVPEATSAIAHPSGDTPRALLEGLWSGAGLPRDALERLSFSGEPVLPSCFRVADVAAASTAAAGLAAAEVRRLRNGAPQAVQIDVAHAEIAYRSERYLEVDDGPEDHHNRFWGYYRCADDSWVQLHTSFAHHLSGALALLGLAPDASAEAARAAVARWRGAALEDALAERGLVGALMRSRAQWLAHPQGQAVQRMPLMAIAPIGDAPPQPLPPAERPLAGVRVLDLTRVIAGPVCGRTLAEHGADVLRVQGPHIPYLRRLSIDTGRGKRSTFLDLRDGGDRVRFEQLLAGCDILVQGYRPGAIAGHGYGPEAAAAARPGIVYVSICAYGYDGPWAPRRGFDSLVQMASGIAEAGAAAARQEGPCPLPCQALDHTVGYLAAFGAMAALMRRATEGGSWHVRLSLAQASEWLQRLGKVERMHRPQPDAALVARYMQEASSDFGRTRFVAPVARLAETPPYWARAAGVMGADEARWA